MMFMKTPDGKCRRAFSCRHKVSISGSFGDLSSFINRVHETSLISQKKGIHKWI